MKLQDIKTGTKLSLEVYNNLGEKVQSNLVSKYDSFKGNDRIVIYAPITKGEVFNIHIGWIINVIAFQDNELYRFTAKVTRKFTLNDIPFLEAVVISEIKRIQRREYYRLPCFIPVKYRLVNTNKKTEDDEMIGENEKNDEASYKDCVAINISGGGLGLKIKEELNIDDIIECKLVINKRELNPTCQVVRVESENSDTFTGYIVGTKFIKLSRQDVDRIVSYIFNEQLNLRRKGLI